MDRNKNREVKIRDFDSINHASSGENFVDENPADEKPVQRQEENRALFTIFASLVIDLLAFTVILPLLPSLLELYGRHNDDSLYNFLMEQVNSFKAMMGMPDVGRFNAVLFGGVVGSLFSLLQFICCPLIGAASDLFGRRITLLLSMIGVLFSYVIWAVSKNFTIFVIARVIGGLCKGNVTICTAAVTDVTSSKTRSKGMALVGVAYSIGFIVGPMIGAVFASKSSGSSEPFYQLPALFAIVLSAVDIVIVFLFFKETLPTEKRAKSLIHECQKSLLYINPVSLFKFSALEGSSDAELQTVRAIGRVYFLFLFFFSGLEFTLTFLTHKNFQYTSMNQGMMFFYVGSVMATVQGGYVRRLPAGAEKKTAVQGIAVIIPGMILVGLAKTTFILYAGLTLFSYGSAVVVPCLTALISRYGSEDQKGRVMGIFRSLGALARGIAPFVFCTVYWSVGAFWSYVCGASCFLLPLFLL
ncbi:predicted protein, partial [Nematostella vectensis]